MGGTEREVVGARRQRGRGRWEGGERCGEAGWGVGRQGGGAKRDAIFFR